MIDDPDLAARQFLSLIYSDLQMIHWLGGTPTPDEMEKAAQNGVRTFLAAFGGLPIAVRTAVHGTDLRRNAALDG